MISKKKRKELYSVVSESIMDARIKVARLHYGMDKKIYCEEVERILFDLYMKAPVSALEVFDTSKQTTK